MRVFVVSKLHLHLIPAAPLPALAGAEMEIVGVYSTLEKAHESIEDSADTCSIDEVTLDGAP